MSLRPQPTRWFELLVMRSELSAAIDLLARSARVELQSHGEAPGPLSLPECREMLEEFDALEQRYGRYWPTPRAHDPDERAEPHDMLEGAMMRLRRWALHARDPVERLQDLDRRREDLRLLKALFRDDASRLPNMKALSQAGPMLKVCLYRLATDEWPQVVPETVITHRLSRPDHVFLLAVGLAEEIAALERQLETQ